MLSSLLAFFVGLSRLLLWFGFHVGNVALGKLCWLAWLSRDVTGEPCWNHGVDTGSALRWKRRYAAGSAMLRLWHGLGLHRWLVFKARVQRTGFQVSLTRVGGRSKRVQEHKKSVSRGRARTQARRFKLSGFWTSPTSGWSNQSVGTGQSPACPATFARHFHVTKNNFLPLY